MEELQGAFALNKPGWFIVQNVAENEFLNKKLENDSYGIWYSVQFAGNAETFLWQTKTPPQRDERYWGWLENTKSGKSVKFKWDKQNAPTTTSSPQNGPQGSSVAHNDDKEDSIARAVALKAAVEYAVGFKLDDVLVIAEIYLAWLKNSSGTQGSGEGSTASPQASQVSQNPGSAVGQTGYAQAKAAANRLKQPEEPLPEAPEDLLGWIQDGAEHGND